MMGLSVWWTLSACRLLRGLRLSLRPGYSGWRRTGQRGVECRHRPGHIEYRRRG